RPTHGGRVMRRAKRMTEVFGGILIVGALMVGAAGAQSSSTDTKDATTSQSQSQSEQGQQGQQAQPAQPNQAAPGAEAKSESRSDYRCDTRTDRIVETDRGTFLGMNPTLAMIIGAVLFVVIIMAMVAMNRKGTTVETRRTM